VTCLLVDFDIQAGRDIDLLNEILLLVMDYDDGDDHAQRRR